MTSTIRKRKWLLGSVALIFSLVVLCGMIATWSAIAPGVMGDLNRLSEDAALESGYTGGAIVKFSAPSGYKLTSRDEPAYGYTYSWTSPNNKDVIVSISSSGQVFADQQSEQLLKILKQPPHTLSADDISSMRSLLRETSDPASCKISEAATKDIDGKRVIYVRGNFAGSGMTSEAVFANADAQCTVFQKIAFWAPTNVYEKYRADAQEAFGSLRFSI